MSASASARATLDSIKVPQCIPAYFSVLSSSTSQNIRFLAASELKKRISDDGLWTKVPQSEQDQIKAKLLELILADSSTYNCHSTAPLISEIATAENNLDKWPKLVPFVQQVASKATAHREVAAYLLFTLSTNVENSHKQFQSFVASFNKLLVGPESNEVKVTAVRALGAIAPKIGPNDRADIVSECFAIDPAASDKILKTAFQTLFPIILQVIDQIIQAGNIEGARQLFGVLESLLVVETQLLTGLHIADLCRFLLSTGGNLKLKSEMRTLALQTLNSTVQTKRSFVQSQNLVPSMLGDLMQISAEPESTADANPPQRVAQSTVSALATSLPPNLVFPALRTFSQQYVSSPDPNKRRSAIAALGSSVEGCSEFMAPAMSKVWSDVEAGLRDPDASVRKAAFSTVGQLCGWSQEACVAKHAVLVPALVSGLTNPVTQSEALKAIGSLLDILNPVIDQYLPLVVTHLSSLLQTAPATCKPVVVSALGSAANAAKEKFLPYFPNTMAWLRYFLLHHSHEPELRGAVLASIGRLALAVGPSNFRPYLSEMSKAVLEGAKSGNASVSKGCSSLFGVMAQMYNKEFVSQQPDLVNVLLANSGASTEQPNANGASPEAKEAAIDAISSLAAAAPNSFSPFVERSTTQLVESLSDSSEGTRRAATDALFKIIKTSYDTGNQQKWKPGMSGVQAPLSPALKDLVGRTLPQLLEMHKVDDNKGVISGLCVGLAEVINKIGPAFTQGYDDTIRGICRQILEQKALCQRDPGQDPNAKAPKYQAQYDSALVSSGGTLVAALANASGASFANEFATFSPLITSYYDKDRSLTDRACSIGCLGDIIKGMKAAITPWASSLMDLFSRALKDEAAEIRSNAAFSVGVLVENCGNDLSSQYRQVWAAIQPLFTVVAGDPTSKLAARENAAGAVARLIIRNAAAVPLDQALPTIMESLPIKHDSAENAPVFRALCQLHRTHRNALRPYQDKMLNIFASVLSPASSGQIGEETRSELIQLVSALNTEDPGSVRKAGLSHLVAGK